MSTLAFLYTPVSPHQRRNGNGYELPSLAGGLSLFPFLQQPKGSFLSSSPPNLSIAIPSKSASESTSNSGLPTSSSSSSSPLPSLELEQGPQRYAAYAMRLKTLIVTSSRYIAYSSDIGEAFRPLTRPEVVRAAYGISWLYLISDVAYAGYKAANAHETAANEHGIATAIQEKAHLSPPEIGKQEGADPSKHSETSHVGFIMARRAVFQSLASMALPAFTIHSIVRYSAPLFAKSSRPRIRAAGPTVAGLLFVPALPFIFDEPVEHVVDIAFDWIQERIFAQAKQKIQ